MEDYDWQKLSKTLRKAQKKIRKIRNNKIKLNFGPQQKDKKQKKLEDYLWINLGITDAWIS